VRGSRSSGRHPLVPYQLFIKRAAKDVSNIAAAFAAQAVIVQMSDFQIQRGAAFDDRDPVLRPSDS
jgi:hypothetical protein